MNWGEEMKRCIGDGYADMDAFIHTTRHMQIPTKKNRKMVCLYDVITSLQKEVIQDIIDYSHVYILKSRKEGISTIVAAYNYRHLWLIENYEVLVASVDDISTKYIKGIYQMFHDGIPPEMMEHAGYRLQQNTHEMIYHRHPQGEERERKWSTLRAMTATSEGPRGSTPNAIHFSEFAQYRDIQKTLDAFAHAAVDDCELVYETTARGTNEAKTIWENKNNGIKKTFISWINSPKCTKRTKQGETPPELKDVVRDFKLSKGKENWATDRLHQRSGSNWNKFSQEYPWTPEVAFISSGTRYFAPLYFEKPEPTDGLEVFEEFRQGELYSMGVDTASGSPEGDYSGFTILRCTDPLNPKIVATYRERIEVPRYAQEIYSIAKEYSPLITIEVNGHGLDVIHRLQEMHYPHLYQRRTWDKNGEVTSTKVGWHTGDTKGGGGSRTIMLSRLLSHVRGGEYYGQRLKQLDVSMCERLKSEFNTLVYTKTGKVEHDTGQHDDVTMSLAMALMGMDQCHEVKEIIRPKRPTNIREMLLWEQQGRLMSEVPEDFWEDGTYKPREQDDVFPEMDLDVARMIRNNTSKYSLN